MVFSVVPAKNETTSSIKTFCRCRNCKTSQKPAEDAAFKNPWAPSIYERFQLDSVKANKPSTIGFSGFGYMPSTSKINAAPVLSLKSDRMVGIDEVDSSSGVKPRQMQGIEEIDSVSGVKPREYKLFREPVLTVPEKKKPDWLNDVFHDAVDSFDGPGA